MLLLAADTSGKHGSIALAKGNADGSCEILEIVPLAGGTFSAQLVPQIAALLSKHGFHKQDVGAFAVASGPGSFTGLRVGLAAIKAMAEVMGKPIAVVSRLEAVARNANCAGKVIAALDAGRGEIYVGQYDVNHSKNFGERLLTWEEFVTEAAGWSVVTPDEAIVDKARAAGLKFQQVEPPRADSIARLGWRKILARDTVSPENLEANYVRRSDAEIFSKLPGSSA